jgi:hypothetical protein
MQPTRVMPCAGAGSKQTMCAHHEIKGQDRNGAALAWRDSGHVKYTLVCCRVLCTWPASEVIGAAAGSLEMDRDR